MKVCSKCKKEKEDSEFHKHTISKDGLRNVCKECRKIESKEYTINNQNKIKKYREDNKDKINERRKEYRIENKDILSIKFKKYYYENIEYFRIKSALYAEENKDLICKKSVDYYYKNRDKVLDKKREYNKLDNNKIKSREYRNLNRDKRNNYEIERLLKDGDYRLKRRISDLFKKFLKGTKNKSTFKYLNYTLEEVKIHLENQFDNNMSWENYGAYWSIDHIIPQSLYDYTDENEIKKCWNLKNLRPLEVKENISKHNKLDIELIKQYSIEDLLPNPVISEKILNNNL
jgi:hypothetical protein